jgi:N-acetylmuramoyl-L-alanine amidase
MKKIFLIDPGHGGMIGGKYMTDPIDVKFFKHQDGVTAYEGVINRYIAITIIDIMKARGIQCINICPSELDLPMSLRVNYANDLSNFYGIKNCVGISIHSNAGGGSGFEIYTGEGQNQSDVFATMLFNRVKSGFPTMKMRTDDSDGDPDKEAKFYMVKNTLSPWILPEFLFFDYYPDWKLLRNPDVQLKYAQIIVDWANEINLNSY